MTAQLHFTRREMLVRCGMGFGALGLADLAAREPAANPLAPRPPHFPARRSASSTCS